VYAFRIRVDEGQDQQPLLLPDTVWIPAAAQADWALADAVETRNVGGLRSRQALASAILQCLFTDRRCPDDHPLRHLMDDDARGWWGDGVDVKADRYETAMGSLLWLLERAPLTENIRQWSENLAQEALQTLIDQGVAVKTTATAVARPEIGRLELTVAVYGRDGLKLYEQRFEDLWQQAVTT
jgi:phage gp46-like protein